MQPSSSRQISTRATLRHRGAIAGQRLDEIRNVRGDTRPERPEDRKG
jgi:hypothetical protein